MAEPLPASTATSDLLSFAYTPTAQHTLSQPFVPALVAVMSRQQPRAAEREVEKQRRRQQEQARRTQRAIALQKGTTAGSVASLCCWSVWVQAVA